MNQPSGLENVRHVMSGIVLQKRSFRKMMLKTASAGKMILPMRKT
jgi:hypothetical protein